MFVLDIKDFLMRALVFFACRWCYGAPKTVMVESRLLNFFQLLLRFRG